MRYFSLGSMFRSTLLSMCAAVAMQSSAHAQTLTMSFTSLANFAYQLDCVAQYFAYCAGVNDFTPLWKDRFGIDPAQSADVKRWREIREAHKRVSSTSNDGDMFDAN